MGNTEVVTIRPRKGDGKREKFKKTLRGFVQSSNEEFLPSRSQKTAKLIRKSPEGRVIELQKIKTRAGKLFSLWSFLLPRLYKDNINSNLNGYDIPKKFMGRSISVPEPLPLPTEWRKLLPEVVKIENFYFDFENEWVHTHFSELYEAQNKKGRVYIEPSKDRSTVFFIGSGDYACHYFLELDK